MLRPLAAALLSLLAGCALGDDGVNGRGGGAWDAGGDIVLLGDAGEVGGDAGVEPTPPGYDAGPPPPPEECTGPRACTTGCGTRGTQACVGGLYQACAPPAEACNGADDDCDGAPDDGFACAPGAAQACTTACGSAGVRVCNAGCGWDACAPPAEICNGADDDCDGARDDGFACPSGATEACATSCGTAGVRACNAGCGWDACAAPAEICNGVDDDCDGSIDDGDLCGGALSCFAGACQRTEWTFEAEGGSVGHGIGRADADGWSASTPIDPSGTLVYGPYTNELPPGTYEARYRLLIDNHTANTDVVARIDVNDFDGGAGNCGTCVLVSREIRRNAFAGAMSYQDFTLTFSAPPGHRLEFRTTWTDRAFIRQDRVAVRRLF
jgi:hypothetical protein